MNPSPASLFPRYLQESPEGKTKICGVVCESTPEAARQALQRSLPWLDCAELRLDYLQELNSDIVQNLIKQAPVPLIATLRPVRHGGFFQGDEAERFRLLQQAHLSGAVAIDLEEDTGDDILQDFHEAGATVILSYHNYDETPDEIARVYHQLRQRKTVLVKIATLVQNLKDLIRLHSLGSIPGPKIVTGMGECGQCTRILAARFGSMLSYAVLNQGKPTAPGQLLAQDMVQLYRVHRIQDDTKIYGVLGWPVSQSLSPLLHNTCFQHHSWDGVYVPLGTPTLDGLRDLGEAIGFYGFSITHPHKQKVPDFCDRLQESAQKVGMSNTISIQDGCWTAYNTDLDGFIFPLEKRCNLKGLKVVVYGSGGAASAVVCALRSHGARVTIISIEPETGQNLAIRFNAEYQLPETVYQGCPDIVVNATPLGMQPHLEKSPCDLRQLIGMERAGGVMVYDLVYNPPQTPLLQQAEEMGCQVVYGFEMFIGQAARQFYLWTGKEMPKDVAYQVVTHALHTKSSETTQVTEVQKVRNV